MKDRIVRPGWNFEYLMWIFTRISGIGLILLALAGFAAALLLGARYQMDLGALMRWTFFPNPSHVVNTDVPDITLGWATAFWQIMQMLLIVFGVTHGFNGLRVVIEDYIGKSFWRPFLRGLVSLLWIFMMIVSIYVILLI